MNTRGLLVPQNCWTTTKPCLYPTRESLDFLVKLRGYLCNHAASRGSVRLLKWGRVNNLGWSTHTCSSAARTGHLPALQYLHENGCPWNSNTCTAAAISGHLPTLQYVHENGCPWNSSTCAFAAHKRHWDCLQYAVDNKCPEWEIYANRHAEHLTYEMLSST